MAFPLSLFHLVSGLHANGVNEYTKKLSAVKLISCSMVDTWSASGTLSSLHCGLTLQLHRPYAKSTYHQSTVTRATRN